MQRAGSPAALPHAPPGELPAPREPCTKPRPPGTSQREPGSPPVPPKRKGEGERGTEGRLRPRGVYPPSPPASLRAEPSCSSLQPGPELGPGAPLLIPAAPLARRQPPPSLRGGVAEDGGGATAPGEAAALRGAVPSSPVWGREGERWHGAACASA